MRKGLGAAICFLFSILLLSVPVKGAEEMTEELIEKMEFDEVQDMLNEMLGEGSFSFSGALKNLDVYKRQSGGRRAARDPF